LIKKTCENSESDENTYHFFILSFGVNSRNKFKVECLAECRARFYANSNKASLIQQQNFSDQVSPRSKMHL